MRPFVIGMVVALVPRLAAAQPGVTEPAPHPEEKSEGTALALSLGTTAAAWGLVALGSESKKWEDIASYGALTTIFTPSIGHWYAGKFFTRGMGVRLGGAASALMGVGVALSECPILGSDPDCESTAGGVLIGLGAVLFAVGTIDDIVTAPGRVREYNRRLHDVAVVPAVHDGGAGLALAGRF